MSAWTLLAALFLRACAQPSPPQVEDYLWVRASRGQTCTSACQDAGGPCEEDGLALVTTASLVVQVAALANTQCGSTIGATAGWAYAENPAICEENSCCGDASCKGICTFGWPSAANCDAIGRVRFCSCTSTTTTHSTTSSTRSSSTTSSSTRSSSTTSGTSTVTASSSTSTVSTSATGTSTGTVTGTSTGTSSTGITTRTFTNTFTGTVTSTSTGTVSETATGTVTSTSAGTVTSTSTGTSRTFSGTSSGQPTGTTSILSGTSTGPLATMSSSTSIVLTTSAASTEALKGATTDAMTSSSASRATSDVSALSTTRSPFVAAQTDSVDGSSETGTTTTTTRTTTRTVTTDAASRGTASSMTSTGTRASSSTNLRGSVSLWSSGSTATTTTSVSMSGMITSNPVSSVPDTTTLSSAMGRHVSMVVEVQVSNVELRGPTLLTAAVEGGIATALLSQGSKLPPRALKTSLSRSRSGGGLLALTLMMFHPLENDFAAAKLMAMLNGTGEAIDQEVRKRIEAIPGVVRPGGTPAVTSAIATAASPEAPWSGSGAMALSSGSGEGAATSSSRRSLVMGFMVGRVDFAKLQNDAALRSLFSEVVEEGIAAALLAQATEFAPLSFTLQLQSTPGGLRAGAVIRFKKELTAMMIFMRLKGALDQLGHDIQIQFENRIGPQALTPGGNGNATVTQMFLHPA